MLFLIKVSRVTSLSLFGREITTHQTRADNKGFILGLKEMEKIDLGMILKKFRVCKTRIRIRISLFGV